MSEITATPDIDTTANADEQNPAPDVEANGQIEGDDSVTDVKDVEITVPPIPGNAKPETKLRKLITANEGVDRELLIMHLEQLDKNPISPEEGAKLRELVAASAAVETAVNDAAAAAMPDTPAEPPASKRAVRADAAPAFLGADGKTLQATMAVFVRNPIDTGEKADDTNEPILTQPTGLLDAGVDQFTFVGLYPATTHISACEQAVKAGQAAVDAIMFTMNTRFVGKVDAAAMTPDQRGEKTD